MFRIASCQTNRLFILLERAEKEIRFSIVNSMFKPKMDIDRHGPRLMPNNCKNLNPPYFSLPSTFKQIFGTFRFSSIFSLHFAYFLFIFASDFLLNFLLFRFDVKQTKFCLFSLQIETKFSLQFQFSLPKRKRGRTLIPKVGVLSASKFFFRRNKTWRKFHIT